MEAGAHYHEDPGQMTQGPRSGAVREAKETGSGWLAFAAAYLFIAGGMNVLWGAAALANKSNFHENSLVWSNLNTWGWVSIIIGALQILAAFMTYMRTFAGQWLAGTIAALAIFANFLSVGAYPIWSLIALVANALVIWAVTAHGDEFDD